MSYPHSVSSCWQKKVNRDCRTLGMSLIFRFTDAALPAHTWIKFQICHSMHESMTTRDHIPLMNHIDLLFLFHIMLILINFYLYWWYWSSKLGYLKLGYHHSYIYHCFFFMLFHMVLFWLIAYVFFLLLVSDLHIFHRQKKPAVLVFAWVLHGEIQLVGRPISIRYLNM